MGKKSQKVNLGRSIVKDKFGKRNKPGNSILHTSEIGDGQDWNRINFQSITEQTNVDEFLSTAELAGNEFQAEKLNVNFVQATAAGVLTEAQKESIHSAQEANREFLRIPRRPSWDITTTPEQLAEAERMGFLTWRKSLAKLQEVDNITLTPFEKNLEFWRQLWRVIERSDVVIQILDARNPLLFRCEDLEAYVREVSPDKDNLLLINKSDFLTDAQREAWAHYFRQNHIKAVFFSALNSQEETDMRDEVGGTGEKEDHTCNEKEIQLQKECEEQRGELTDEEDDDSANVEECRQDLEKLHAKLKEHSGQNITTTSTTNEQTAADLARPPLSNFVSSSRLLNRKELIDVFRTIHTRKRVLENLVTIGMVGYPNVGKSSTINSLMQEKKVPVSATPGKTKHFQTLYLTDDVLLCDCPGLVFPGFVSTKEEMIISGILPVDQLRDEVPPINLLASHIPRKVFENVLSINLPQPMEGDDPHRPPTSEELLNAYGFMRGYMTHRGLPDNPRSARYILKDYINGKLLYAHAPPTVSQAEYHTFNITKVSKARGQKPTPQQLATQPYQLRPEAIDRKFFTRTSQQYHIKGINKGGMSGVQSGVHGDGQPRKKQFKKREKLRRKFAHLDQ